MPNLISGSRKKDKAGKGDRVVWGKCPLAGVTTGGFPEEVILELREWEQGSVWLKVL